MQVAKEVQTFSDGLKAATATGIGYISIGLAFGMVAAAAGVSVWQVAVMSFLVYGGSSQFAFVSMLLAGQSVASIIITVFFINLRNMLMSLHAATLFQGHPLLVTVGIGSLITDESYGVLLGEYAQKGSVTVAWMYGNNLLSYLAWGLSTVVGAWLGGLIPNPELLGLDFALVTMFIGIFVGQFRAMRSRLSVAGLGSVLLVVAVSFYGLSVFVPSSVAVLLATLMGCGTGVLVHERL